jgi:LmbE family N-acetylglucosaminyl deacetylase
MRLITLSPHLDDAALCVGGLIHDQANIGTAVEIWTVMAGVPEDPRLSDFALQMHAEWGTSGARETISARRDEDKRAAAILGAASLHFEFLDAIYRRGADGEPLYADPVGARPSPGDADLPARIRDRLATNLRDDDALICLLGIGGHVDHVCVRQAAELLGRPLAFVADFPYILRHPASVEAAAAGQRTWIEPVSERGVSAWIEAVLAYQSQLSTVFRDADPEKAIRAYWASTAGVRVWGTRFDLPVRRPGGLDSAPKA